MVAVAATLAVVPLAFGRPKLEAHAARASISAEVSGLERMRTALTVDGHHCRPPCAVGTASLLRARAIAARPSPRAY